MVQSNNLVIQNNGKSKLLISKEILRIKAFRSKLRDNKVMHSKKNDDLDHSYNNDLGVGINNDESSEFDTYIKQLYTNQEKHK